MCPDLHVLAPHGVGSRTALGFHPRDGRPVACWVVHPTSADAVARSRLDRLTAALGLGAHTAAALTEVADHRASLTAAGGWATLWVGDDTELVAQHDDAWLAALLDRGWAMVVVGYSTGLGSGDNATVMAYLTSGRDAHVGVVRAA
ncbi:hypothetical protein [Cellulomonas endometrii]|uniref:hypothetical protein n=1 Tax=Cellulomonas endometrii TaxID=3036301 RepID=UPI0024ACE95E|nr:hypothetical protein [Cellulomonas endometrii]